RANSLPGRMTKFATAVRPDRTTLVEFLRLPLRIVPITRTLPITRLRASARPDGPREAVGELRADYVRGGRVSITSVNAWYRSGQARSASAPARLDDGAR